MNNTLYKYIIIIFLLMVYINRGFFIAAPETECSQQESKPEINSVIELLIELTTGKHNDIDEDGNSPEAYNAFKILQPFVFQSFNQALELWKEFSIETKKISFPIKEKIPHLILYCQIDHPPQF